MTETQAAVLLLAALPQSWGAFVTAQQNRAGLTVATVLAGMLQHESIQKMGSKQSGSSGYEGAFFMKSPNKFKKQNFRDNSRDNSGQNSNWSSSNKKSQKCTYCKKPRHFWRECRKKKFDESKRGVRANNNKASSAS